MLNIGITTSSVSLLHRKFRWYFKAMNDKGDVIFPGEFVRVLQRPELEGNGIIEIEFFNGTSINENAVDSCLLELLDGCGNPIENWTLNGVKLTKEKSGEEYTHVKIKYESIKYEDKCPVFSDISNASCSPTSNLNTGIGVIGQNIVFK